VGVEGTTGVGIIANDTAQPDYPTVWAFYNTEEEIQRFLLALRKTIHLLR
jgi:hypothetical protein